MSELNDEVPGDEQGAFSADDEDQLQPEDTLDQRGVDDMLDEGYSPPERPRAVESYGMTAEEQEQGETLDMRLEQELPDDASDEHDPRAHVRPEDLRVGGDEPESIDAEDDFLADAEVGDRRAGRLVAPDEGAREDAESDLVGADVGIDGAGASAEEAAVHVVDDEDGSARTGSARTGSARTGSARTGSARTGSATTTTSRATARWHAPSTSCRRRTCTCTSPGRCASRRWSTWPITTASGSPDPSWGPGHPS
ncbi:DUF5709 domain-containing protein [Arsenicicoccus piscis]|uniref:DUF5709 domain-containing protein n=1 Tax=Arsenicicoccus piscis TaxID=673954 RepID=UPI001F4D0405|nr:DUF5709 domain-containing protein [Arsenicicoccus piscis]MCH8627770.1 DUF5709 domain-containing protein [Arsenicicoccus piscis]